MDFLPFHPLPPPMAATGFQRLDVADGGHAHDAELLFDGENEMGVLGVVGEQGVELASGGRGGLSVGKRQSGQLGGAVFIARKEPFEGDAGIEANQLAEAGGQLFVVHGGAVLDVRRVAAQPSFEAGLSGDDTVVGAAGVLEDEGVVEGWFEVGETGTNAETCGEIAGRGGPEVRDVIWGWGSAE